MEMADLADDPVADLEDGEIESDGEAATVQKAERAPDTNVALADSVQSDQPHFKESKKKKPKNHNKTDKQNKMKNKKNKFPAPFEDDFAGNIEKAIRKVLKNDQAEEEEHKEVEQDANGEGDGEMRRKNKKRKKHDAGGSGKKKRRRQNLNEDLNDDELMFTRGASPVRRSTSPYDKYRSDDSYASDNSFDDPRNHHHRPQRNRPHFKERKNNKNHRDRRRDNIHPLQDPDGVCIYYMQGKCHKGEDCTFSHAAQPPRKMELCKFYLMDCCAKRDKCLYLHSDFPCKYYHTGLPCIYKDDCKFAHGKPLTENFKSILLKHIESAPKEILGEFPRLSRESAAMMVANTQMRLAQQFSPGAHELTDRGIPSIFELNVNNPINSEETGSVTSLSNQYSHDKLSNKMSQKIRQSRWQNPPNMGGMMPNLMGNSLGHQTQDVLSIKNLTGVLTQQQISDLTSLGIENLNQLSQLTVIQLNHFGINIQQIQEIQLNTRSIQKLGLINGGDAAMPNFPNTISGTQDFDMRIAPMATEIISTPTVNPAEVLGNDVDMRFVATVAQTDNLSATSGEADKSKSVDPRINKDAIDIDQYTKDALKFASKEKENIDNMSSDHFQEHVEEFKEIVPKSKDIDHRVLQYVKDISPTIVGGVDTDIRFLQPEYPKKAAKRHRRSTTDDEDNNLLIDEKWYSSDEEKNFKSKSPKESPRPHTPPTSSPVAEPTLVLNKLGDLSKIDITDEVTKLLTAMKNNLHENKDKQSSPASDHSKPRDPRSLPKRSPEHKSPSIDLIKIPPHRRTSTAKISIYECIEGEPTDGRKRIDVDLRQLDQDFRLPGFGDTDLRQTGTGDTDFRFGLPFKPLPNYTPATEIDGSINCHPPIVYKLRIIDIPRPDYMDIKNSTAKSQAMADPRLRKLFRLSVDEPSSDTDKSVKTTVAPRADPRRKPSMAEIVEQQKPAPLDLQNVTNSSTWYKELSTNQKIFVNQQLATITSLIKKFQQERTPGKRFDVSQVHTNPILFSIFNNLGVSLDDSGEFSHNNKSQEGLLKPPMNFNSNPEGYKSSMMDINVPQMPLGNVGPMGNMNMNPLNVYNATFPPPDTRSAPGLLGVAPNMPHSFDNPSYCLPNFGPEGFHGNMPFNNGNDFGGMDSEQNYYKNQNRGNYSGRGNDRWNRGGNNRGNRDRRNYSDRGGGGGWKN